MNINYKINHGLTWFQKEIICEFDTMKCWSVLNWQLVIVHEEFLLGQGSNHTSRVFSLVLGEPELFQVHEFILILLMPQSKES